MAPSITRRGGEARYPEPHQHQQQSITTTPLAINNHTTTIDIATGPLSTLLPKLAKLLQDEYNLQRGAKKGIKFLYDELEYMHTALCKIGEVPREQLQEQQCIWARDVRELSYDMEDIVDTFMVDIEGPDPPSKKGVKKIFKKMMRKVNKAMARREVAQQINDIKERAKELAERRERYKVDDIAPAKKIHVDPRLKALYTEMTEIVGIEEAKKEVITMLTEENGGHQKGIVSIAGFGGLGKTTLAKAVYDEIQKDYTCTAFVSVSRNPDANKLLKHMLYELHKREGQGNNPGAYLDEIKHLIDCVRDFLQNKRYLIVIDDIWAEEPWDKVIRLALIENYMGSKIITTTRIIDVAEHIGGCYRLKPLSYEYSEMLFYGRIFFSKGKCPSHLFEVSKRILKKCGGVPLAIVTMSSMLANKPENIEDWKKVCDSIGSGLGGSNTSMDDMRKILLLGYYDLPSHLKTCLLYLSIFPEDYVITKDRLIWRWVAEGFIIQKRDQGFLEIAENYFNELLNRSMILSAGEEDMEGKPNACRVHDVVLDVIIFLSKEECFVRTKLGHGMEKVRRLSLHNSTSRPTMNMPKLRSLTMFGPFMMSGPAGVVIDPTISHYRLLRVLDLQGCKVNKDLASLGFVGSLSHLRYLGLPESNTDSPDQLPIEIGKLRFLQTLDLSETRVNELPLSVITGLGQLICLRGKKYPGTRLPDGLNELQLTSLEVLESVAVFDDHQCRALGHLTQLRVLDAHVNLRISHNDDKNRACVNALVESIGKLKKIESIKLWGPFSLDGSIEELGNLQRLQFGWPLCLPTWINPATLPALSSLDVKVSYERREDIRVLGTLPCLRHLKFQVIFSPEEEEASKRCAVGADAFPCAISCEFDVEGEGVVPCTFPQGAMPRLQHFMFSIPKRQLWQYGGGLSTADDLSLGHLPSLRSVTVPLNRHSRSQDDKFIKDRVSLIKEKLEREAAVHPNHPLRIQFE